MQTDTANGSLARLTVLSVGGLIVGVGAGLLVREGAVAATGLDLATAAVRAWTNGFRLLVLPLIVTQLYLAIAKADFPKAGYGRLAASTLLVFAGLLVFTATLSVLTTLQLLKLPWLSTLSLTGIPASSSALPQALPTDSTFGTWVDSLIPPNLIAVAATDNLLPVMLFAVAFGIAARRVAPELREPLDRATAAANQASFVMVAWLLQVSPLVVLALGYQAGAQTGIQIGAVLAGFVGMEVAVLILATVAALLMAALLGRIGVSRLLRAMGPAHLTAATTRSSLATVPMLLEGARQLRLPEIVSGTTIPLAGATLKLSQAVASPLKLIFLAHVLGLPIGLQQVVVFSGTILLLSPATAGVPRVTSGSRSLPAYVAAGIPAEYVVLLGVTTWIADIFMTVLNSTGYQTANILISRTYRELIGKHAIPAHLSTSSPSTGAPTCAVPKSTGI